ncbi:probable 4-coumarate--CoA ligase 1 [Armigeres subalbatus]|uniref:probable 4-coumarate--CoA ligase 1 n=1 Tax=Armigeres subalbatus TaxID=124917 RepID=UPI002ED69494
MSSAYDPEKKIWSGVKLPGPFNPQANLGQLILNTLERNPSMVAQVCVESGVELTCEEIRLRAIRAAQNLTKLGYKKGDMIGFAVRNRENVAPLVYGCFLIGAPINCIDPDFTINDIAHMFRISKPVLVVADRDNVETVKSACRDAGISPRFLLDSDDCKQDDISILDVIKETGSEQYYFPQYLGDSEKLVAAILCSSGTTGMPKGICLSHAQLIHQTAMICNLHLYKIPFSFSSLYWASGFFQLIQCPFNSATHYISTRRFSPEAFFEIVEKQALTTMFCPPAQMTMILQSPLLSRANLSSLKSIFSGGGFVSTGLRKSFEKMVPSCTVGVGYGTSEIGYVSSDGFGGKPREGSVGTLAPNIEAKILNDDGNQVGVNEQGVLWFRYQIKPIGYLYNQEATDEIMTEDGWVCSGDIGYFDKDCFLFVVDRKKEIIKYKNYQISPAEIEAVIEQLPEVAHVCVVGLVDSVQHTDLPTAVVQLRRDCTLSEASIVDLVAAKLADFKHLRGGVFFADELPMTKSGKLQRYEIRKYAEKRAASNSVGNRVSDTVKLLEKFISSNGK